MPPIRWPVLLPIARSRVASTGNSCSRDRQFLYLPFEHSELLADQERACSLFRATGDGELIKWAELHIDIIRRFGRFPHRNKVLGRDSTVEEQVFLEQGGFTG